MPNINYQIGDSVWIVPRDAEPREAEVVRVIDSFPVIKTINDSGIEVYRKWTDFSRIFYYNDRPIIELNLNG